VGYRGIVQSDNHIIRHITIFIVVSSCGVRRRKVCDLTAVI